MQIQKMIDADEIKNKDIKCKALDAQLRAYQIFYGTEKGHKKFLDIHNF